MTKTVEELRIKLEDLCIQTNTKLSGIDYLIKYYTESLHWKEIDALQYVIKLFHNGIIEKIKFIGKDGEEL